MLLALKQAACPPSSDRTGAPPARRRSFASASRGYNSTLLCRLRRCHGADGFAVDNTGLAITGARARWETGRSGPTLAVVGELDALLVPGHPFADSNGVAHACCHHAQIGIAVAVAAGLSQSGGSGIDSVAGSTCWPFRQRRRSRSAGSSRFAIRAPSSSSRGKQEFVRLGVFDGIDLSFFTHATSSASARRLAATGDHERARRRGSPLPGSGRSRRSRPA